MQRSGTNVDSYKTGPLNEEQLRANRFELVSRLADDIAHEIKNPLNAIVINLEVLKVRISRGDSEAALDRVSVIDQEARRLHNLVDRMLQLLRPEREDVTSLALDQVLDELLPLVEARARLARNTFRRNCAATVFVPVRRDVFKFAVLNLLTSVHERLGDNGGTITFDCSTDDQEVRLIIGAVAGDRPLAPPDADYERSLGFAAALLALSGGRLERAGDAVTVLLPRAAAVEPPPSP
jgi:signal transduction histidine kinase